MTPNCNKKRRIFVDSSGGDGKRKSAAIQFACIRMFIHEPTDFAR